MPETKQIDVSWELANDAAADWARRHSSTLVTDILDTTRDKIRRSVAGFVEGGENLGQLRNRIADTGAFSLERAQMIATTEVTASYAEGNIAAWNESGVTEGKMWNTANDELVCPICGPLDGTIAPLNGEFEGGFSAPPAHPRCRCWVTPKVIGDIETGAEIFERYGLEREPGIGVPSTGRLASAITSSIDEFGMTTLEMAGPEWPQPMRVGEMATTLTEEGYREMSDTEKRVFLDSLDRMDPRVKKLWRERATDLRLVTSSDIYLAKHQGNFIFLGEGYLDSTAQHEFIHHMMTQEYLDTALKSYQPELFFQHAKDAAKGFLEDEDLTMMLSGYDDDDEIWADNIFDVGEIDTLINAVSKVKYARRFLGLLGF